MALELRAAEIGDAARLAQIHLASWRLAHEALYPREALDAVSGDERLRAWRELLGTELRDRLVLVAESDGRIIGFATSGPARDPDLDDRVAELYELFVEPDAIGSGVGHALLRESESRLRARGFVSLALWVVDRNEIARRFYEKEGLRPDGSTKPDTLGGPGLVELRYLGRFRRPEST